MKQKRIIIVGATLAIVIAAALYHYADSGAEPYMYAVRHEQMHDDEDSGEDNTEDMIAIPCFDYLVFRADKLKQKIKLENPTQNKCYFQIRLILPDGNEIYSSDMIAPGETVTTITLNTALSRGQYEDAILQYSCYTLDTLKALNGANIKVTLEHSCNP